ncbi:xanthine dehydrogenase [Colletotrichum karsti]|uniref:xanthine dehydrogenase n=1 Tax=Colletotrichum karsti TaxID=1095194 RepID=A0A9P6I5X6_9PEZI|nr:xanthine dehydrogenase [Colletotrichum karsti]KAF9876609.1 xanthine dehydrogenase [Colletotrichum karsti]
MMAALEPLPSPPLSDDGNDVSPEKTVETLSSLIKSTYQTSTLKFFVNGRPVTVKNPNPDWALLDWIRAQDNLKGTKLGCGEGGCGACTVVLQVAEPDRRIKHIAVNACLYPLIGVDGKSLITIEGLGNVNHPHPLQERIAKMHGTQCGFCTPGIVMSLYALIRNSYRDGKFYLSHSDVELQGHLDGNLCRCTGYKPIFEAARTFVTEDLKGLLANSGEPKEESVISPPLSEDDDDSVLRSASKPVSCGRPGGCCRDTPNTADINEVVANPEPSPPTSDDDEDNIVSNISSSGSCGRPGGCCRDGPKQGGCSSDTTEEPSPKTMETPISAPRPKDTPIKSNSPDEMVTKQILVPYDPTTEPIFPPSLWRYEPQPICYGDDRRLWFRPTTLDQLIQIKAAHPSAKIVGGASETQIEVRFKKLAYQVSVFAADIAELNTYRDPGLQTQAELSSLQEVCIPGNLTLTKVEELCTTLYQKLGAKAFALEALRKQLRYFAGRQIRNVASLAGSLATASPISDSAPVLLAAGAKVSVTSHSKGSFEIPLSSWFIRYRTTALPEDGVITQIIVPLPPEGAREVTKAYKQAKRKDDDIAIVTAGLRVRLDEDGLVEDAAFAFGGMAPTTVMADKAQHAILGKRWAEVATLEAATDALLEQFNLGYGVPGGMAQYRRVLTISMFFRYWHEVIHELGLAKVNADLIQEIHRGISSGGRDNFTASMKNRGTQTVGRPIPHLSALKHCTGEAEYLDDMPKQHNELFAALVLAKRAHAELVSVDYTAALEMAGVVGYIDKNSPAKGTNIWGAVVHDEQLFADGTVTYYGQVIACIYAETALQARAAADRVEVTYNDLPAIFTIDEAIKANSFFKHGKQLRKGDAVDGSLEEAWSKCDHIIEGTTKMGGQEHFYLETNAALAIPHIEDGSMEVYCSTQNLMENQVFVAQVLGLPMSRVNMRVRRMGGAYGGKESRSTPIAMYIALAARKANRPVRMMLNRDEDMAITGQRHPFQARWKAGVDSHGKIQVLDMDLYNNGGASLDMSGAVMDRACTHVDNCYYIPHAWIRGWVCKTNTVSNTAFRGFGGPQGMYMCESVMYKISEALHIDVDELRRRNLYEVGQRTPFLQEITDDFHVPTMLEQLTATSEYEKRKAAIREFNTKNRWKKRGIAKIPTKFGLSFATAVHLNQAGAYVKIYEDGSVLLHHGGTEMGQGLYTKMAQVAAEELGVSVDEVFNKDSQTDQVANASPTAASSGSDLNGQAVKNACDQLRERLAPYREKYGADAPMSQIAHAAYQDRVNLAANGFWKMPRIGYEWGNWKDPLPMYYYWTQGVAISEVELDTLTGDSTVLRTDIMMDIGRSINPAIDYGQIEGAFVQGQGLFTMEESLWTKSGELFTKGPGTYKIPGFSDIPQEFNVSTLQHDSEGNPISWSKLRSIQSSKGTGEPPLFLGCSVFFALREAVKAAREMNHVREPLVLNAPSTAEKLRLAVGDNLCCIGNMSNNETETPVPVAPVPASPIEAADEPAAPSNETEAPAPAPAPAPAAQIPADAIEAADEPADPSEFDPVEWDARSSDSASLSSSVYAHEYENGRRYHSYRHGRYPMPNDEGEKSREDMKHALMMELTDGKLFYSPIGDDPRKIIDIGTGTGIWAIEVADQFPGADVLAFDLSPMQPSWVPPNLKFLVDDAEDEWLNGGDFDLIHLRTMATVLKKTDKILNDAYENLKPGGWVEFQELHFQVQCDDGSMAEDDKYKAFHDLLIDAFNLFGMNMHKARDLRPHIEAAGFKNIHCEIKKVPIGIWAKDKTLRLIGKYMQGAVLGALQAFEKPLIAHGLTPVEAAVWTATARKEMDDLSKHRYFNFYFWYAQKPLDAPEHSPEPGN